MCSESLIDCGQPVVLSPLMQLNYKMVRVDHKCALGPEKVRPGRFSALCESAFSVRLRDRNQPVWGKGCIFSFCEVLQSCSSFSALQLCPALRSLTSAKFVLSEPYCIRPKYIQIFQSFRRRTPILGGGNRAQIYHLPMVPSWWRWNERVVIYTVLSKICAVQMDSLRRPREVRGHWGSRWRALRYQSPAKCESDCRGYWGKISDFCFGIA